MARSLHTKKDGSTVVKDANGRIVDNLPGAAAMRGPASSPARPDLLTNATTSSDESSPSALAGLYEAFGQANQERIAILSDRIATLDRHLASVYPVFQEFEQARIGRQSEGSSQEPLVEPTVSLDAIKDITISHKFAPGSEITIREAVDLYRLEKAVLREERTKLLMEIDARNGLYRIKPYGDGDLGTSVVEGWNPPNSKAWLLARTNGIGGSDKIGYVDENNKFVAYDADGKTNFVFHMLKSKSPLAVSEILDGPDGIEDESQIDLPLRIGNALERTVQYDFAVNHPEYAHLEDKYTRTALGRPHHRFNPDGVLQDLDTQEFGVFEAKTARSATAFDAAIPGYKAQCLHNCAASGLSFAVLVADVEGEAEQRVIRLDFTDQELQEYRDAVDRAWYLYKPRSDAKLPVPMPVAAAAAV